MSGGKTENVSRINDRNGRLALGEDEVRRFGRIILTIFII